MSVPPRNQISPLDWKTPIVNEDGTPTLQFLRLWQQLFGNEQGTNAIASGSAKAGDATKSGITLPSLTIVGNKEAVTGPVEDLTLTQVLDFIGSAAQGDILYRDAANWARLPAGTSGNFLKTQGASANPIWAAVTAASGYEAGPPNTVPTVGSLTWINQLTATASNTNGGVLFNSPNDNQVHALVQTAPATPYDVYCRVDNMALSTAATTTFSVNQAGIYLRNSSTGAFLNCVADIRRNVNNTNDYVFTYSFVIDYWSAVNTYSSTPVFVSTYQAIKWIRTNVTSTTVTLYGSMDGRSWFSIGSDTIATHVGAVNQYGMCSRGDTNITAVKNLFGYFSTTAPS